MENSIYTTKIIKITPRRKGTKRNYAHYKKNCGKIKKGVTEFSKIFRQRQSLPNIILHVATLHRNIILNSILYGRMKKNE